MNFAEDIKIGRTAADIGTRDLRPGTSNERYIDEQAVERNGRSLVEFRLHESHHTRSTST